MIVSLDISGNFIEGRGTTGVCFMGDKGPKVDEIRAVSFSSPEAYWKGHTAYLFSLGLKADELEVVMEGFRLYGHKKNQQVNSIFETPMLIGIIRQWCYVNKIPLKIQYAVEVKNRWTDAILEKEGWIYTKGKVRYLKGTHQLLNNHKTDALRHLVHYLAYTREKHLGEWEHERGAKEGGTV